MTNIAASSQLLLFDGALFQVDSALPLRDYPTTTPDHPIALLSRDVSDFHRISIPHTCKPPKAKLLGASCNDLNLSKVCSKCLFDIRKTITYLLLIQDLIRLSVKWFVSYLKTSLGKARVISGKTESKLKCLKTSLEIFEEHYRQETSLLRVISTMMPGSTPPAVNELTLYFVHITEKAKYLMQIREEFDKIEHRILQMEKSIIEDEVPKSVFIDEGTRPEDRLKERISVCSNKSREIHKFFKRFKTYNTATSEEKQKQMFEKQKLAEQCDTAISVLLDKCVPDCRKLHKESTAWFINNMKECLREIETCDRQLNGLRLKLNEQDGSVREMQKVYQEKMTKVEEILYQAMNTKSPSLKLRQASSLGCRDQDKKKTNNLKRLSLPSLPTAGAPGDST